MMAAMEEPALRAQRALPVPPAQMAVVQTLMAPMEAKEVLEEAEVSELLAAMGPTAAQAARLTTRSPMAPRVLTAFPVRVAPAETAALAVPVDKAAPAELGEQEAPAPIALVTKAAWVRAAMAVPAEMAVQAVRAVQVAMGEMAPMVAISRSAILNRSRISPCITPVVQAVSTVGVGLEAMVAVLDLAATVA